MVNKLENIIFIFTFAVLSPMALQMNIQGFRDTSLHEILTFSVNDKSQPEFQCCGLTTNLKSGQITLPPNTGIKDIPNKICMGFAVALLKGSMMDHSEKRLYSTVGLNALAEAKRDAFEPVITKPEDFEEFCFEESDDGDTCYNDCRLFCNYCYKNCCVGVWKTTEIDEHERS